jgi:NAD(P)H dehydrogenase (quinone)
MFAVAGITGKVGAAVARSLLSADQPVRAVIRARSNAAASSWAQLGCEIAVADLSDPEALAAAFEGTEGVFALLPPIFDPAPGFPEATGFINTLATALVRAKCPRVVALSTIGADATQSNLLNVLGRMEEVLGKLPMPVTFLRAAWFMENAAWDIAAAKNGVIHSYLQPLDRTFPMVSSDDIGRVAAALLQERWEGKRVVELEGPQRVSPNALAAAFGKVLATPVRAEVVPRERWEAIFRAEGMKNPTPRIQMVDGFNAGWIDFADHGAHARKGSIGIDQAIATLIQRNRA